MSPEKFFDEVLEERNKQKRKYGREHDDEHMVQDWALIMVREASQAVDISRIPGCVTK